MYAALTPTSRKVWLVHFRGHKGAKLDVPLEYGYGMHLEILNFLFVK